jgi:Protein kinase domain
MGAELAVGEEFAGHRVERLLGRGGMGVVYLAEHERLGRKVALKLLSPDLAGDDDFRRRFLRESRAAAALEHPNIVPVYDAGQVGDAAYISMRFVDGSDLAAYIRTHGPLPPEIAIPITEQVASALDAAHGQGLVHRDVKPGNILLETGRGDRRTPRAFLSDFGITKRLAASSTEAGEFLGTIDYMAPEQITGRRLDGRTDQYSLACVLFTCLTGEPPFRRDDQIAVMYAHLHGTIPSASELRPGLPTSVDAVLRRGMSKRPEERFGSCSAFVEACRVALGMSPSAGGVPRSAAGAAGVMRSSGRRRRAGRVVLVGILVATLVAGGAAALVLLSGGRPHTGPRAGSRNGTQPATSPGGPTPTSTGSVQFPTDILWDRVPDSGGFLGGPGRQVINRATSSDSRVVAVGFDQSTSGVDAAVWVSSDGLDWVRPVPSTIGGPGDQVMNGVTYSGSQFVAVGTNSAVPDLLKAAVWRSPDGNAWKSDRQLGALATTDYGHAINKVIEANGALVAVGWDSRLGDKDAAVWRSTGSGWTKEPVPHARFGQEMWAVTPYGSNGFAAVGEDSGNAAAWTSLDGETWQEVSRRSLREPGQQVMKSVVVTPSGLVAVGRDGTALGANTDAAVWRSQDGVHWTRVTDAHLARAGHQELTGVITFRSGLIAFGEDNRNGDLDAAIWLSADGVHWQRGGSHAFSEPGSQEIKSLLVYHQQFVAVGTDAGSDEGDAAVWLGHPIYPPK